MKDKRERKERKERKARGHKYYIVKLMSCKVTKDSEDECNSKSNCSWSSKSSCSRDWNCFSCNDKSHSKSKQWSYDEKSYSGFFKK